MMRQIWFKKKKDICNLFITCNFMRTDSRFSNFMWVLIYCMPQQKRILTCSYTKGKINNHTTCFYRGENKFELQCLYLDYSAALIQLNLASVYVCSVSLLVKFFIVLDTLSEKWRPIWDQNTDFCNPPPRPQGFAILQLKWAWGFSHGFIELLTHFV